MPDSGSPFSFLRKRPAQILTLVLLLQAAVFYGRARNTEDVPPARPLSLFPVEIKPWYRIHEGVIEKEVQDVLRADDLLTRQYASSKHSHNVNLFVAYFHSQRSGKAPHSPKNCLPGSGWVASSASIVDVAIPGKAPISVNRYLVSRGESTSLVMYWYQSHNRVVASEYWAKIYLVLDSIRLNRSDTSIVRVVVPVLDKDEKTAEEAATQFIQSIFPTLETYFPV
jgi:EpsI family protein